jgi:hypothetical protein
MDPWMLTWCTRVLLCVVGVALTTPTTHSRGPEGRAALKQGERGDGPRVLQRACGNERLVSTIEHVERSFPNGARLAMKSHVLHLGEKVVGYLDDHGCAQRGPVRARVYR